MALLSDTTPATTQHNINAGTVVSRPSPPGATTAPRVAGTATVQAASPAVGEVMPDPFASNVRLLSTVVVNSDTQINVSGLRYEVTRLATGVAETPRATLLGDQYFHQGVIVALDSNGFTQESMQLWYPKSVFIPKWLPVAKVAMLVSPGSSWRVEIWG